ncbi:MAG: hypothetical protein K0Q59_3781 [Paenibacillus sp.]|jgi:putative aldouronate transport system substrate-binding protein|nr:hypothetical protein [Paenibacillus sp.]
MKTLKVMGSVMLVSAVLLSACGSKDDNKTPAASGDTGKATANQKLDLRWFIFAPANASLPSGDKDFVKKKIEEKFNVSLKIEYLPFGTDYDNKINVIMTGGDHPDMFLANGAASQKFAVDGLLADQTPFVTKETMPNYFKWITEDEIKNYQLKGIKYSRSPMPFQRNTYGSFYIRKDWLDKFGLQLPKSYDELMTAMKKFTNDDPDGNGKKDTYGFSAAAAGGRLPLDFPAWINNGLVADFMINDKNLEFVETQSSPQLQNVLQNVKDMIKDGVVDPDWFVNKSPQHFDKAAQGKVGVFWSTDKNIALESVQSSVQSRSKQLDPKADWQPIFPFKDQPYGWKNGTTGGASPFLFSKTVAEKNPDKIKRSVQILDWLASEEGYLLTHYGQEGTDYKRDGKKITIDPAAYENDVIKNGNFLEIWKFFTNLDEPSKLGLEVIDPRVSDRDRAVLKFVEAIPKHNGEPVALAPPEGMNIGDFRAQMAKMQNIVIFDDKDASNWMKYRDELMTKYKGKEIFQAYVDQINAVRPADKQLKPFK